MVRLSLCLYLLPFTLTLQPLYHPKSHGHRHVCWFFPRLQKYSESRRKLGRRDSPSQHPTRVGASDEKFALWGRVSKKSDRSPQFLGCVQPCLVRFRQSIPWPRTVLGHSVLYCTNTFWNHLLGYNIDFLAHKHDPQGGGYCSRSEPSSHRGKGDWLFGFKGTGTRAGGSSPFRTCVLHVFVTCVTFQLFVIVIHEQGCTLCAQVRLPGSVCERCGEYYFVLSPLFSGVFWFFASNSAMPRQAKSPAIPKVMVETSIPPKNGVPTWRMYSTCVVTIRLWHIKVFTSSVTRRMIGVSSKWFDWLARVTVACFLCLLSALNVFIIFIVGMHLICGFAMPCFVISSSSSKGLDRYTRLRCCSVVQSLGM